VTPSRCVCTKRPQNNDFLKDKLNNCRDDENNPSEVLGAIELPRGTPPDAFFPQGKPSCLNLKSLGHDGRSFTSAFSALARGLIVC
jgi:hypothetical protein